MSVSLQTARIFDLALKTASLSTVQSFSHGVVITHGSRILRMGVNRNDKTHPKSWSRWTQHAEFCTILGLGTDYLRSVGKTTLYSARISPCGEPRMSKPCAHCMRLIQEANISKVVWWDRNTEQIEVCRVRDME